MNQGLRRLLAAITFGVMSTASHAALIPADIVWIFDTSGSMGDDIAQVKARIVDFNTAMVNAGVDAQYGLVRFGGANTLIQDIVPFATFNAAGGPFQTLTANGGGTEEGSEATNVGLNQATFRAGAKKNFILVTDEDDDSSLAQFNAANSGLTAASALFNFIGVPGTGNTNDRYGVLAAGHGGSAFSIAAFRANPGPFFENFIQVKVGEIIGRVPEPGSLALLGLALAGLAFARRKPAQ